MQLSSKHLYILGFAQVGPVQTITCSIHTCYYEMSLVTSIQLDFFVYCLILLMTECNETYFRYEYLLSIL